jgi:hypothetical protein
MALTKLQKRLRKETEEIAEMVMVDFWNVEKEDRKLRTVALQIAISRLVIAEVITQYTLFDEVLADYLCRYYFKKPDRPRFIYWNQKKFRVFVHFMLDEMYLLKRMQMVHAIKPLPKDIRETMQKVNAIRNAMAHSFFPENRKEYMKVGKVLYSGKDIRTPEGLKKFQDDCREAQQYFRGIVDRVWHD